MNRLVVFLLVMVIGLGASAVPACRAQDSKVATAAVQVIDWKDLVS
jgi:hypothetical protein